MARTTERAPPRRREHGKRVEPYLFVVIEGARLGAGGCRVALSGLDAVHVGRGEARAMISRGRTTLALEIPDPRLSATHARIVRIGCQLVLEDAGSTNGTMVHGAPITRHVLSDGDVIGVGQTLLMYREIDAASGRRARSLDSRALADAEPGFATLDPSLAGRLERLSRVARSLLSVLILGETGTGKEMLARGLHALSRRPGPFVAVNCGAIPPSLVESQLFGHVRGAFSGALKDEPGLVRAADGGTLLLDEIGDLPPSSQAALLRVLQDREVRAVGATRVVSIDVRILAATHQPIEDLVERGGFRRDLYARLAGYTFTMPALRARKVDLGLLIAALRSAGKLGEPRELAIECDAALALLSHEWPMNVRELEQSLHAAILLADGGRITSQDLPPALAAPGQREPVRHGAAVARDAAAARREALVALLAEHRGNLSAVARELRTSRTQVQRLLERYGLTARP